VRNIGCLLLILLVGVSSSVLASSRLAENSPPDPRSDYSADEVAKAIRDLAEIAPTRKTADFAISKFNRDTVKEFANAWARSQNGSTPVEGVVLIYRMADGSYKAKSLASSNEYKSRTFRWHPGIIAIIHTHPNVSNPRPQADDIKSADKFGVPVFTITSSGMFVYDPFAKRIDKVKDGLDWLQPSQWLPSSASLKPAH